MSLNITASGDRIHIGIFGRRNVGKSSIINAITKQNTAIVSETLGTTTDPVYKAMELLPLGPVMIIDTPGLDDDGDLGKLRIQKTMQVINKTDLALIVINSEVGKTDLEADLINTFKNKEIPFITVFNKSDILRPSIGENEICVSAATGENIDALLKMIASKTVISSNQYPIISDLINEKDTVIMVVPIDSSAPKGRIILPQQQTLREILDKNATAFICQPNELRQTLKNLKNPPKLVVTDSQAFSLVEKIVPQEIFLTSFSILLARHKGQLSNQLKGSKALDDLKDGDFILISEGCTHHRQCRDIGTVKLPALIKRYTNVQLNIEFTSGHEFPEDLSKYALIVHCGGCMLNSNEMKHRIETAKNRGIPITNYGMVIAKTTGILDRSLKIFENI